MANTIRLVGNEFGCWVYINRYIPIGSCGQGVSFPIPSDEGKVENEWMIHQLKTTAKLCEAFKISYLVCWGLNFQIEHHLFPNICHVHYKKISDIVKATAEEYDIFYNDNKTYFGAVKSHYKMLKQLGVKPNLA